MVVCMEGKNKVVAASVSLSAAEGATVIADSSCMLECSFGS